jgi:23S rRNA (adenine2030-N6)-methyltransferase
MNYRHAFHAGNFADVLKHAVLVRILVHLRAKAAPFRVLDTHAGAGCYDLNGPEASRSGEWREGIARLIGAPLGAPAHALLAPYFDAVAACNPPGALASYPGSPALARAFLRAQDRLIACELDPAAAAALAHHLGQDRIKHDRRVKALAIDGWTALNAWLPPKERRGLVLIDPPFEAANDLARLAQGLETAHRKWAGGIYLLWYPIAPRQPPEMLLRRLRRSGIAKILRAEITVGPPRAAGGLGACGLIIVNPPWTLQQELDVMLPELVSVLSEGRSGSARVDWLVGER